ncbi:MAG: NUDIX domain-containing protein [Bryobacteraceae bacterium]
MAEYNKVGLLAIRDGRILLCRKKHTTSLLILPGGCLEVGETATECLRRELREELGPVEVDSLAYVGTYEDSAAGDEGKTVKIQLYSGALHGEPRAESEIKELYWFGPEDDPTLLAPSIFNKILPDLLARGILWPGVPVGKLIAPV